MKNFFKVTILTLGLLLFMQPLYAVSTCKNNCEASSDEYTAQYEKIYGIMKDAMTKAPITGNATEDFLYEMLPHHEAAVQMSQAILNYTSNAEIKSIANAIIKEQKTGILKMQRLLQQAKTQNSTTQDTDHAYIKTYESLLNTMLTKMATPPTSCDVNIKFLEEMIPHHEGAIAMAKNVLKYTTNPELKEIATQIVETQQNQLPQLQNLLTKLSQ